MNGEVIYVNCYDWGERHEPRLSTWKVFLCNKVQSTTRITDFFVVGNMSGVLVGFVILVGAPIETRRG